MCLEYFKEIKKKKKTILEENATISGVYHINGPDAI
jgi:hypothetical protein